MNGRLNLQSGYIALTSVIIISALLLAVALTGSAANYFNRLAVLGDEFKQQSFGLARACVNYAAWEIAGNPGFNSAAPYRVTLGRDECTVLSVTQGGGQATVIVQGQYPKAGPEKSYTNLTVVLDAGLAVVSWQETAD
jgi:hypothetical protein